LFICHGNINRSAYAAAKLRDAIGDPEEKLVSIRSAGFIGPGRNSPPEAQESARRRGVDLSTHVSRVIDSAEVAGTALIFVMDAGQKDRIRRLDPHGTQPIVILGDLDPHPVQRRGITDPYGHDRAVFETVFAQLDRCIDELSMLISPALKR
jgi:protein-tyrosine phosphatase